MKKNSWYLKSDKAFQQILQDYGKQVADAAKKALAEEAEVIANDAKSRCPVRSGNLKNSIHTVPNKSGTRVFIIADAVDEKGIPYGRIVEFSSKIQKPYVYPAMDEHKDEISSKVADAIKQALHDKK
jgi:hypothetical protein